MELKTAEKNWKCRNWLHRCLFSPLLPFSSPSTFFLPGIDIFLLLDCTTGTTTCCFLVYLNLVLQCLTQWYRSFLTFLFPSYSSLLNERNQKERAPPFLLSPFIHFPKSQTSHKMLHILFWRVIKARTENKKYTGMTWKVVSSSKGVIEFNVHENPGGPFGHRLLS